MIILNRILNEMALDTVDWIYFDQDRDQQWGCFEHGNERLGFIKFSEFLGSSAAVWLLR